jgi:hypothetical protein
MQRDRQTGIQHGLQREQRQLHGQLSSVGPDAPMVEPGAAGAPDPTRARLTRTAGVGAPAGALQLQRPVGGPQPGG